MPGDKTADAAARRDQITTNAQQAQQKFSAAEQQLAQPTGTVVSRNNDLSDVEGQIQTARQQTAEMQAKLAAMHEDLAREPAPPAGSSRTQADSADEPK